MSKAIAHLTPDIQTPPLTSLTVPLSFVYAPPPHHLYTPPHTFVYARDYSILGIA